MSEMPEDIKNLVKEYKDSNTELSNKPYLTMESLKSALAAKGEEWRLDHETVNEKTGKTKKYPVSPRAVADILQKECTFCLIGEDDPESSPLAVYDIDNGIYNKGERFINSLSLTVERTLNEPSCKTVRHYLTVESVEKEPTKDKNLIIVNNGIYDKKKASLVPFSDEYIFVNKIATNYIEDAAEPKFDDWNFSEWIDELSDNDEKKKNLLYQIFAVAVNSNYISEVAFFFVSEEGRTGKSTFQNLLKNLIGNKNTTSLKIKEFESDFKLASAYSKSLIIGDDNNPKDFNQTSENFKSVITGELVLINPKMVKPFSTILTPTVIQSMNGTPKFNDVSDGLLRRLRIIRFNHSYKGNHGNRKIKEEYICDKRLLEYILFVALNLDVIEVENTKESEEAVKDIAKDNDPVIEFYEDVFYQLESTRLPTKFIFSLYQAWCDIENNPTKMKQRTFTKNLRSIVTKDGWLYDVKNLAPIHFFSKRDEELLKEWDINYKYRFEVDTKKYQPLIEKIE
ncbi:DNA primase family protein [Carnobacterium mobile]|uniref:DNA primase family protein n=1 Tax=Carnobacterium mobile TaxID=2750 RepID=UPI00068DF4A5|nr:DNA primase family protein [Carnobacterium mobile]